MTLGRENGINVFMRFYLAASSNWLAMFFLLLAGVTQIARIPQTAGTASSSHRITPFRFISNALGLFVGFFKMASLWKVMFPNCRVVEFGFESFILDSSDLSSR